jgi:hypothetical protein
MSTTPTASPASREPELLGQTVVVIGGSSGIGLETARRARAQGAEMILTGRDPERLEQPGRGLGALSTEAFDATDPSALAHFFDSCPAPIDPVMAGDVSARHQIRGCDGRPVYLGFAYGHDQDTTGPVPHGRRGAHQVRR